jgi:hypothetical protein
MLMLDAGKALSPSIQHPASFHRFRASSIDMNDSSEKQFSVFSFQFSVFSGLRPN